MNFQGTVSKIVDPIGGFFFCMFLILWIYDL